MTIRPYTLHLTAREILVLRSAIDLAYNCGDYDDDPNEAAELDAIDARLGNLYASR